MVLHLPEELREANEDLEFLNMEYSIKTLGITWRPNQDVFVFKVAQLAKRRLLSDIAKVFDLLGWLSPITVQLKQMMQPTWETKIGWDELLPDGLKGDYLAWRRGLQVLKDLELNRFALCEEQSDEMILHVFCDASEKAYAACFYVLSNSCQIEGHPPSCQKQGQSPENTKRT